MKKIDKRELAEKKLIRLIDFSDNTDSRGNSGSITNRFINPKWERN